MDVLLLSRLQFAAATMFHFLFVPLTLGLSILVAWMETQWARTGDEMYLRMTQFWGKIFMINFALGVVTGITLEFQFGTNWSRYSTYVGDIFGSLLAIEASAAFFLESTMMGVWIFGWKKLSAKAHATVMWLVAFASSLSAVWILTANAWMQHPVGYTIRDGRAEVTSFWNVVSNPFAILEILHTLSGAYILSAFFVMGVSAWYLLKDRHIEFFTRSFRIALVFGCVFSLFSVVQGDIHGADVARKQPAKLAAMEAHWETQRRAPLILFAWPDQEKEKNVIEIGKIPGMVSLLALRDINAEVRGLRDFPKDERPPVFLVSFAFKGMVGLGFYFALVTLVGLFLRKRLLDHPLYLKLMMFSIPLPYLANELGWVISEVGRQPWIVYGMMKTGDAVSPISLSQVATTLTAFVLVYGILGLVGAFLVIRHIRKGPELQTADA
jgi:cytochrome d ubiquinol oxidase subunit I